MAGATPQREYLGFSDAIDVEWRVQKEADGRLAWHKNWGDFMELHDKWVRSDIRRVYRKPSYQALEWLVWQRKFEVPQAGEWLTRQQGGIQLGPPTCPQVCKPGPWPVTTSGEVGWLAQHKDCHLEIYDMKYNSKPPLPWYMTKISARPIH